MDDMNFMTTLGLELSNFSPIHLQNLVIKQVYKYQQSAGI